MAAGGKRLSGPVKSLLGFSDEAANAALRNAPVRNTRQFTFRGDTRSPDLIFNEGFTAKGTSTDLFRHALDNTNPPSAFISTSRSSSVAGDFADQIFVVRPRNGIDVNRALGNRSPFPNELEIAIPRLINPNDVRAVTLPGQGRSILNPNFRP